MSARERSWYEMVIDSAFGDDLDALMKLVRDEMAAFFDVVNNKEFKQIEQKYSGPRAVLMKLAGKIDEMDT